MSHSAATSGWISPSQPTGSPADQDRRRSARVQERLGRRGSHASTARAARRAARRARPWRRRSRPRAAAGSRHVGRPHRPDQQRRRRGSGSRGQRSPSPSGRYTAPGLEQAQRRRRRGTRLRRATSSSEPSSVVRSCDCSVDIGFSSSSARLLGQPQPLGEVGADEAPADDLVQPLGGQRVGGARGAAAGTAVSRPGGAVARRAASPAASRARRAAPPPRSGRPRGSRRRGGTSGTVTSRPSAASARRELRAPARISPAALARDRRAEQPARPARRAGGSSAAAGPGPPTSIVPGADGAPHSSIISCVATAWASSACSGWSCFSNRADASLRSPSFSDVRWMLGPFQLATSISTRVVSSLRPRSARRPSRRRSRSGRRRRRSAPSRSSSVRVWPSSVSTCLAGARAPDGQLRARRPGRGRTRAAAGRSAASRSW